MERACIMFPCFVNKTHTHTWTHTWTFPAGKKLFLELRDDRLQLRDLLLRLVDAIAGASADNSKKKAQQRHDCTFKATKKRFEPRRADTSNTLMPSLHLKKN